MGSTHIAGTLRLAGTLTKANKNYDMIVETEIGWGTTQYLIRRGWDYLVLHLRGEEPPVGFELVGTKMWDPELIVAYAKDYVEEAYE